MQRHVTGLWHCTMLLGFAVILLAPSRALAQRCETGVAKVVAVQGTVEAQRQGETQWRAVQFNDTYCPGDTLRVQERSRAAVALANHSVLRLSASTTITLEGVKEESTSLVGLLKGAAHFFSRGPRSLEVRTPFVAAGVRSTEFLIVVEEAQTLLSVFEGAVVAANEVGNLTLSEGQSALTEAGKAPSLRLIARPRDAVQWALYYPPVLYLPPAAAPPADAWQSVLQTSYQFYLQGNLQKAFDSLAPLPLDIREPRVFAYRASLLLAVGRVDEARADIARALRLDAQHSEALALQAIMAVVQNEPDTALQTAQQAVQARPQSATAHIALSYAQQAKFDLSGARSSLETAVQAEPNNALAWARLAELHASFGALEQTLRAAAQAVALAPDLARTQTVLGFAYVLQTKTAQAQEAFVKAQTLDQADPLPWLGLGLAKIRAGREQEGSRDIEVAASLDPNNALLHSYLGKAYYEEKRVGLDEREYDTAKGLDPKDPTPWFYDAIAKQTTNRPVEALQSLQTAIERNDNRAVYRSRLLLDSDLAARSASLGRIYSDLGFQQLALVEGWKSVNTEPTNFSAHRLLADSYAVLPRHEIARVSELLQSQLLQPLNITPIQPRLAESNLFLISAGGPGAASFNEFNPIFHRDRLTMQVSGLGGEKNTWAGEGVVAGIYKNVSFSVGGSHFETDGFRINSDQKDDIANAFLQLELTPQTSIQAEYRYRKSQRGELRLRFFPEDIFPGERNTEERHTIRVGGRHAFSPGSILLGSFSYQDADSALRDHQPGAPLAFFDFQAPRKAFAVELQHLLRTQYVNLTTGAGYFDIDGEIQSTLGLDGLDPMQIMTTASQDLQHVNAYAYGYLNFLKNMTFTVGLSADLLRGDDPVIGDKEEFNPKFGITWNPLPDTTIRAAAFRVLKRTLITDQTLEPTQVAGFNQFFDDANGTVAWRYGVAIDQKLTKALFGGVELSRRDLTIPFLDFVADPANPPLRELHGDEYVGRAYLFWAPHPWLALRGEYLFERLETESLFGTSEIDTHRVPLGLNLFHPSGWSAALTATYFNQDVKLDDGRSGHDDFWIMDAAVNYRLPKRLGFITLAATNLFDQKFQYFDTDFRNPIIQPERRFFARVTLQF